MVKNRFRNHSINGSTYINAIRLTPVGRIQTLCYAILLRQSYIRSSAAVSISGTDQSTIVALHISQMQPLYQTYVKAAMKVEQSRSRSCMDASLAFSTRGWAGVLYRSFDQSALELDMQQNESRYVVIPNSSPASSTTTAYQPFQYNDRR